MRFAIIHCLAAAALMSTASSGHAAKQPVKRVARPAPKPNPSEVLARQITNNSKLDGESLGHACRASEFKFLAEAMNMNSSWLTAPKSEFETSEEYGNRISKISSALSHRQIIICESVDDNPDIQFTYQADEERFSGSFNADHNVWRDVKKLGAYRSKTRMGISATVRSSIEFEYDVALRLPSSATGCMISNSSNVSFSMPASRANAPALKRSGYLVTLGRLIPPYISADNEEGKPTLDDPYDIYTRTLTVNLELEKIAFIDGAGSEIWTCAPGQAESR